MTDQAACGNQPIHLDRWLPKIELVDPHSIALQEIVSELIADAVALRSQGLNPSQGLIDVVYVFSQDTDNPLKPDWANDL